MAGDKPYRRDGLVAVATVQGQLPAEVLRTKLEAAGIPAMLQYESAGLVFGVILDGLGQVRVMVPEALAAEAEAVLSVPPDAANDDVDEDDVDEDAP